MKTRELVGPALDWAVANSRGLEVHSASGLYIYTHRDEDGGQYSYEPSRRWEQGGPIIEQEKISITINDSGVWIASMDYNYSDYPLYMQAGKTALIAAMRSYVASKLGEEVEIPEAVAKGPLDAVVGPQTNGENDGR